MSSTALKIIDYLVCNEINKFWYHFEERKKNMLLRLVTSVSFAMKICNLFLNNVYRSVFVSIHACVLISFSQYWSIQFIQ